jgi:hypothetical protein
MVFVFFSTTICLSKNDGMKLEKAFKRLEKAKNYKSYVIGSFTMFHNKWDYYDERLKDERLDSIENINKDCKVNLVATLLNTDSNAEYELYFMPVTGSNFSAYKESLLTKNSEEPYWFLEVPPGNYALTTISFTLSISKAGYYDFPEKAMVTVPLSRDIKRDVAFELKEKQIVYIGDYFSEFKTNIILYERTKLYPYNQFKIVLNDNFEKAKEYLFNKANDKIVDKLNNFEIVSAL